MLPFVKERHQAPDYETSDDTSEDEFDMLGAIAEDMIVAMHTKDKGLLRSALEAFKEELQAQDKIQDIGI